MCKKLLFLICFVSLLGLVSSGSATDYHWTNDDSDSWLWTSSLNWEPVGVPSSCDDRAYIPSAGPLHLDTDIHVGSIRGPAWGDIEPTADHEMLLVQGAKLTVCDDWRVEGTIPYTAYITLVDNAKVSIGPDGDVSFRAHGEHQRVVIDMYNTSEFIMSCDLRCGDEDDDYFELNMTDNAYMSVGNCDDGFRQNEGEGHVTLSGEAKLEAEYIRWRCRTDDVTCTWDITEKSQVITGDDFRFAGGKSDFIINVTDNAVFDIDGRWRGGEDNDFEGTWTLNMPCEDSPYINIGDDLVMIDDGDATGFGQINLHGGTINVGDDLRSDTDNWNIDIKKGVMILDGDVTTDIAAHIAAGRITAYGSYGEVLYDYGASNVGKTTVTTNLTAGLLNQVIQKIIDLGLDQGTQTSLIAKLNNALDNLQDGNPSNDDAAVDMLVAFINEVNAKRDKTNNGIPGPVADELIDAANNITVELQNGCY